jgi:hypothetical protein
MLHGSSGVSRWWTMSSTTVNGNRPASLTILSL